MKISLTTIIIAKDEELMIENCLKCLQWCKKIILINNGSSDKTTKIAENFNIQVINYADESFSNLRNEALKYVETEWLMYVDPDERITPTLAKEIAVQIETSDANALTMHRENMNYGKIFIGGGWEQDYVTRAFRKKSFKEWTGDIHESAGYNGKDQLLKSSLIHLTHRNTHGGMKKTTNWTKQEAELLAKAIKKKVNSFTLIRKGGMEMLRRYIFKKGYRDGIEGFIESLFQAINKVLIYMQVWELQQKPSLTQKYQRRELEINELWKKNENEISLKLRK